MRCASLPGGVASARAWVAGPGVRAFGPGTQFACLGRLQTAHGTKLNQALQQPEGAASGGLGLLRPLRQTPGLNILDLQGRKARSPACLPSVRVCECVCVVMVDLRSGHVYASCRTTTQEDRL